MYFHKMVRTPNSYLWIGSFTYQGSWLDMDEAWESDYLQCKKLIGLG